MMKKLIAALGFLLNIQIQAQPIPTFNRTYIDSLNWGSVSLNAIENNNYFYCLSTGRGLTLNSNYTMLIKVDQNGELLKRKMQHRPYEIECLGGVGLINYTDSSFFAFSSQRLISNPQKININITHFSENFDTLNILRSSDSLNQDFPASIILNNEKLFCVGRRIEANSNPERRSGVLLISDINCNEINFFNYNIDSLSYSFSSIAAGDSNNMFLGGGRYDSFYHGLVVKTDSLGNMLWHRWYPELWGANISSLSDSTYLLTGSTPDGYSGRLIKIDSDGNVIWMQTFPFGDELNLYTSIQTSDLGLVSVGLTTLNAQNGNDAYIQKVDALGNLLWQKSFNGVGSQVDYFSNVIETEDGGLLINGSAGEGLAGGQNLWLVKLDSIGCLEPNCWVGVEQANANTLGVAVYPNPATDWLYLKYDNTRKITLEIFNLSGQRVLQHQHMAPKEGIEISHLPSGLYLLRFVDELGNVATEKLVVE